MTLFTSQERVIILFLIFSVAIGLVAGGIKRKLFLPDYTQSTNQEIEAFNTTVKKIKKSLLIENSESSTKTDDFEVEVSVILLNINSANKSDLLSLPNIGEVTANRIIRYREDYGPFKSIDDLLKVKGIGPRTFKKMKPLITAGTNGK